MIESRFTRRPSRWPHTVGMEQRAPVNPGHYRLSEETWTEIVEAYRDGATARELAVKWKVPPGSVYHHACRDGWSKTKNGDERARAHARSVEAARTLRAEAPDKEAALAYGLERLRIEEEAKAAGPEAD